VKLQQIATFTENWASITIAARKRLPEVQFRDRQR